LSPAGLRRHRIVGMKHMRDVNRILLHVGMIVTVVLGGAMARAGAACAQENGPMALPESGGTAPASSPAEEYRIGPGDVISVSVLEAPELGGRFRISELGDLHMAALPKAIHADGQTTEELSRSIKQGFVEAKQLRDPSVNVAVEEFHGRTITITGAVAKPSVYPIPPRTTLLEALAMAGGLLPNAGSTVTVVRGKASAEAASEPVGSVAIVDMNRLATGKDSSANVEVHKGDVISVPTAEIVYVVGAVTKPGGFPIPDPTIGMSVVQAIAMSEGFTSVAAPHHGVIVRQSTSDAARQEIPVDIAELMTGKRTDVRLAPNDILYVPNSMGKRTLKAAGDVAMAAVNGVAIYGIGYRVGQIK